MIAIAPKNDLHIYALSECAVTVEFGNSIDEVTLNRVNAYDQLLKRQPLPGMYQTVRAYSSLAVFFDALVLVKSQLPGLTCHEKARSYLQDLSAGVALLKREDDSPVKDIPVCYGGELGSDLAYVAGYHQITTEEVIRLHSEPVYKVYMVGFIPGFAYLGGLNPLLETPRKPTPVKVSAGAVGIAGAQTGIYPLETPGGWQIIGQTPLRLFDAERNPPALLKAGDSIRFHPISFADFEKYSRP